MNIRTIAFLLFTFLPGIFHAQETPAAKTPCDETKTSRPSIMVIPRVKEGEDIRTIIDKDFNLRAAIAKVQEAFNARDFTTIDLVAKLKAATAQDAFTIDAASDYKTQLLQYANPDIYVETEYLAKPANGLTSTTVILTAHDCVTGNQLGSKQGTKASELNDPAVIVGGIMTNIADPFLNDMQAKFTEMTQDGRQVSLVFKFKDGSVWNETAEVESRDYKELGQVIEEWVAERAVKHNYAAPRSTANAIYYDDVRIPLRDPVTCRNYTSTMFRRDLTALLRSCNITSTPLVNGAQIIMTID
ncbi:MAG: hypothetical protein IT225_05695 [Flavobacteriales bacterium]|jgi:hypothetical protein|nr:hypothetical protein [Flavobacteriales bacterium]